VSVGNGHVVAVRTDDTIWTWGYNGGGELGSVAVATGVSRVPQQVGTDTNWREVSAASYSAALRTDGTLWTWGDNYYGQLGNATTTQQNVPARVGTASNWQHVSAAASTTAAVRTDGTLWTWGDNQYGQLGDGTTTARLVPGQVGTATDWQSISAGANMLAIRSSGALWAWGANFNGAVGDGTQFSRYAPVPIGTATWQQAASKGHSMGIRPDGSLWAWGANSQGQLGLGTSNYGLLSPLRVGTATNWQSVALGDGYTLAIRTDGTLWTWGGNYFGQLGDGTNVDHQVPQQVGTATNWQSVSAGGNWSVAIRTDGTLWAWGSGFLGNGSAGPSATPVQVGTATNWQSVAVGYSHALAIRTDGTLWSWGSNFQGALGNGQPFYSPQPILIYGMPLATKAGRALAAGLQLAPNPAHDYVRLPELTPNAILTLSDALGRPVRTGQGAALSLVGLSPGLYLLQATAPGQAVRTARLVVE
jgi:alpha-tubulin suppressor-like RCC1 family protein